MSSKSRKKSSKKLAYKPKQPAPPPLKDRPMSQSAAAADHGDQKTTFGGSALSDSDLAALDDFCTHLSFASISFDDFCLAHKQLDLVMPLYLTECERAAGGSMQITYTRTIQKTLHTHHHKGSDDGGEPSAHEEPSANKEPDHRDQQHSSSSSSSLLREKIAITCEVSWPPGLEWNDTITLKRMGDEDSRGCRGDVFLRLTPKAKINS